MKRKKNINKKVRLAKALIAGIFLFFFFGTIFSYFSNSKWDGKGRFTVAVYNVGSEANNKTFLAILFSIEPRNNQAQLITILPETILEVPFGYGKYEASSVYRLGQLDEKRSGGELFKKSVEETLGISIDSYIVFEKLPLFPSVPSQDELREIKNKYFSFTSFLFSLPDYFSILRNFKSDITSFDLLKLYFSVAKLRTNQIDLLPIVGKRLVSKHVLPDGGEVDLINYEALDSLLSDKFQDTIIRQEAASIEVVNSTSEPGRANSFSRLLTRLGAEVIFKNTTEDQVLQTCIVNVADKSFAEYEVVKRIKRLYNCEIIHNQDQSFQSDIKIILGQNFIK